MTLHNQSTMTEYSNVSDGRFCGLRLRELLSLIGSFLLPLMLGVFTVVITLHQQKVTVQQRREDREMARIQREQDLNISREQRHHDLNMLALQREQDLNISRVLCEQDKKIADEKLYDDILVSYINDISDLLKNNNGSLTANPIVAIIARAKTLTAIRQLDISRNNHLIQFLYEAKQLTNGANPLDLSNAELNGIDFSANKNYHQNFHHLSLVGAHLHNSSFSYLDLSNANFSGADLTAARFVKSKLNNADMSHSIIVRATFSHSELANTNFTNTQARLAVFFNAGALNATFANGKMESVNFCGCHCKRVNFRRAQMERADFCKTLLDQSIFIDANLVRANFWKAHLTGSNLRNTKLRFSNFTDGLCEGAIFAKADLTEAHFVHARLRDVDFTGVDMRSVDFSDADLLLATLANTTLDNAKLNDTIVTMANFSFASMKKAFISDNQLFSALSIRGVILPNSTVIKRDHNLLQNGHADCNYTSLNNDWQIFPINAIAILLKPNSQDDCLFVNEINNSSSMSQRVNLTRYIPLVSRQRAILVVTARGGGNISFIHINDHKDKLLSMSNFTQGSELITIRTSFYSYYPKITIQFSGYGWCDDIELSIEMKPRIS